MRVQPFPFGALPPLTRADVQARRAVRSRLALDAARLSEAFQAVLGVLPTLETRGARERPALIGTPGDVGILLAPEGASLEHAVLLELEGALAASLVAIALRGQAPMVHDTTQVPSARVIGAAAAVVLAITRRLAQDPVRVLAAGPAHALAADLQRRGGAATWAGALSLQNVRYEVRLTTQANPLALPVRPWSAMHTPLEVPLVLARLALSRAALGDLEVGDALLVPEVDRAAGWLATPQGEHGLRVKVAADHVVVADADDPLPWVEENMNESFQESLGEVPVVVRVEVGSVQLPAKRWADVLPGDTLTLGQRVGAPVTLRVAGVEVAHGELVQVEGELGVRIVKRLDLPGDPTQSG